jgi:hypothetical protein
MCTRCGITSAAGLQAGPPQAIACYTGMRDMGVKCCLEASIIYQRHCKDAFLMQIW